MVDAERIFVIDPHYYCVEIVLKVRRSVIWSLSGFSGFATNPEADGPSISTAYVDDAQI